MTETTAEKKPRTGIVKFIRDTLVVVLLALVISFVIKTFLVRAFYIPSGSMEATLQIEDRVLVDQIVSKGDRISRGDIVVFHDPGGWLNTRVTPQKTALQEALTFIGLQPDEANEYLIKRVIGVAGDRVKCCSINGKLEVNGVEITEPYVQFPPGENRASELEFDVEVPAGSLWVMGDNRYHSKDSRYNQNLPSRGFVSTDEVVGRAFLLTWPFNRFGVLGNYPEVFADVPNRPQIESAN